MILTTLWVLTDSRLANRTNYLHCSDGADSITKYEDWVGVLHLGTM